jgi:beta-galactosidase
LLHNYLFLSAKRKHLVVFTKCLSWKEPRYGKPYIMIEYGHAMGNSLGNFDEYWQIVEGNHAIVGGFIWDWVNQTFNIKMPDGTIRQTHGADFIKNEDQVNYHVGGTYASGELPRDHCVNGLINSDRTIQPMMHEVKKVQQYIGFEAESLTKANIRIKNKYHFLNLNEFKGSWVLYKDGIQAKVGEIETLDIEPGKSKLVNIPIGKLDFDKEYTLNISFVLKESTIWADAGHTVAEEQFIIQKATKDTPTNYAGSVNVSESSNALTASGKGFEVVFDKQEGVISSIKINSVECISQKSEIKSPQLNLYRSPIDNDTPFRDAWPGLKSLSSSTTSFKSSEATNGELNITIEKKHNNKDGSVIQISTYTIYADGVIKIKNFVDFNGFESMTTLPRIGLKLALAEGMEDIKWYGRGPHENYPDRKASAFIGQYKSSVTDLFTPYLNPQENGARTDVRWLETSFRDKTKPSITIESDKSFIFSALHYDAADFDKAIRPEHMKKRNETILSIDSEMLGLGNASCGPPTMRKFQVPLKPYQFEFTLRLNP